MLICDFKKYRVGKAECDQQTRAFTSDKIAISNAKKK